MNILIYDIEVFKEDWLVIAKDIKSQKLTVVHNNNAQVKELFSARNNVFGGFNNKHYDDWIIHTMLLGGDNHEIKKHNDWIISGKNPWEFPFIQFQKKQFYSFDLRDDLPINLSLKAIEANLNQSIVETGVDFNIKRKLTPDELATEIKYCTSDVENTCRLYQQRKKYLESKILVGKLKGISANEAIGLTNAKLTARFLDAKLKSHNDEFDYPIPSNLQIGKYEPVVKFFKDPVNYTKSILNGFLTAENRPRKVQSLRRQLKELDEKGVYGTQLETEIAGVSHVYGWGGLHGAIPNYFKQADDQHKIIIVDVSSYYPSLMIQYDLISRNTPSPKGFKSVYERRIAAKNSGDSATAGALKLVLNTTYGASKNKYNDLYDPRQANAVCVHGQLFLTDLIDKLESVESFELIQSNTDGLVIRFKNEDESAIEEVLTEWERRTKMNLERTIVKAIAQKDVNNYVMKKGEAYVYQNGEKLVIEPDENKIKTKGGYVSLFKGGDFKNRSLVAVHKAVVNYFMNNISPEETIKRDSEVIDFQMIAKTGSTYDHTIQVNNDKKIPVQRVNRVYAAKNENLGTLYKVKKSGRKDKIAGLPGHCMIDNQGKIKLDQIDTQFYIEMAKSRIEDYIGKKKKRSRKMVVRKTATTKTLDISKLNIYEKINAVRKEFLDAKVQKSGTNRFAEYKYYELGDIVPVALPLMIKYHLAHEITFSGDFAKMRVVDTDSVKQTDSGVSVCDFVEFTSPMVDLVAKGMNAIQALGAVETYQRRYLYMSFLDVIEQDQFDSGASDKEETKTESKPKAVAKKTTHKTPASITERKEAKKEITKPGDVMDETQKKALINGLKKLRSKDDKYEPWIGKAKVKIEKGLSKKGAEKLLILIGDKVAE